MSEEKVVIRLSVSTSSIGSEVEDEFDVDKKWWDSLTEKEKYNFLEESYADHRASYVEGYAAAYSENGVCLSDNLWVS